MEQEQISERTNWGSNCARGWAEFDAVVPFLDPDFHALESAVNSAIRAGDWTRFNPRDVASIVSKERKRIEDKRASVEQGFIAKELRRDAPTADTSTVTAASELRGDAASPIGTEPAHELKGNPHE